MGSVQPSAVEGESWYHTAEKSDPSLDVKVLMSRARRAVVVGTYRNAPERSLTQLKGAALYLPTDGRLRISGSDTEPVLYRGPYKKQ